MDRRSYTRLLSVQAFYLLLFVDNGLSNNLLLSEILSLQEGEKKPNSYDPDLFNFLLDKFKREKTVIDSIIIQFISKDWTIQRMDLMLLSIIRASVCELSYLLDIPVNIIVDEYVNLSAMFLTPDQINFVNAILSTVANNVRKTPNIEVKDAV